MGTTVFRRPLPCFEKILHPLSPIHTNPSLKSHRMIKEGKVCINQAVTWKTFYVFRVASCQIAYSFLIIPPLILMTGKRIMPSKISIGRATLLAGLVCLTVGCASLDKRMKRFVGKPIDAVIKFYGVKTHRRWSQNRKTTAMPTSGAIPNYSYAGREYEGSSQNGPIITN